jgi:hypothetical protein
VSSPSGDPRVVRVAGIMRVMLIGFWVVVMSLVWLLPNRMGRVAQVSVTVWLSLIAGAALWVLHRFKS